MVLTSVPSRVTLAPAIFAPRPKNLNVEFTGLPAGIDGRPETGRFAAGRFAAGRILEAQMAGWPESARELGGLENSGPPHSYHRPVGYFIFYPFIFYVPFSFFIFISIYIFILTIFFFILGDS